MNVFNIAIITTALLLILAGLYLLVRTRNMLRIVIGIEIVMKAVTLVLVFAGYVNGNMAMAQSFIVTMIVLEVVIAVVAVGLAVNLVKHHGSMDVRNMNKLNG